MLEISSKEELMLHYLKLKIFQYCQNLITGRPITGKSRYPDRFEFGYRISAAIFDSISGLISYICPDAKLDPFIKKRVIKIFCS